MAGWAGKGILNSPGYLVGKENHGCTRIRLRRGFLLRQRYGGQDGGQESYGGQDDGQVAANEEGSGNLNHGWHGLSRMKTLIGSWFGISARMHGEGFIMHFFLSVIIRAIRGGKSLPCSRSAR